MSNIKLSHPDIGNDEINEVVNVLSSGQLSLGPKIEEFETLFSNYCGTKYAIACNSGTSALHLVAESLGINGGEIITTPFSFIASSNCAIYVNARPKFVDIDPLTWNIDHNRIEENITSETKAILPVHVFGPICDIADIRKTANSYALPIIEDSCEALGSSVDGMMAGSFGDAGVFGFYPNKQITTGEGGMVVTDRDDIAEKCRSLRNQGRGSSTWLSHSDIGYNYRMPDINAAIGIEQLKRINTFISKRKEIVDHYKKILRDNDSIEFQFYDAKCSVSWFAFVIKLHDSFDVTVRNGILEYLKKNGIGCNNYFAPLHLQKCYEFLGYKPGDFPVCENISDRTITLPLHTKMSLNDVEIVCEYLIEALSLA